MKMLQYPIESHRVYVLCRNYTFTRLTNKHRTMKSVKHLFTKLIIM